MTDLPKTTFKKADGFLLVYDATKEESATCLANQYDALKEQIEDGSLVGTPLFILGIDNQVGQGETDGSALSSTTQQIVDTVLAGSDSVSHLRVTERIQAEETLAQLTKAIASSR